MPPVATNDNPPDDDEHADGQQQMQPPGPVEHQRADRPDGHEHNAAHRVHNPALSDAENDATFGKCNNPNWHGHNYTLDVSVTGPIDERTGYVIDLGVLKRIVEHEVVNKADHRNFNLEVDFMRGV